MTTRDGSLTRVAIAAATLALVLGACGSADTAGPPEINYGRDICVQCGMIITEEKFAAAYTLDSGEERVFDDLGDLVLYTRDAGEVVNPLNGWVHDFETLEWVDLDHAWFVPTLTVTTPMGHSIVSFSDEARAHAFASDVGGEAVQWAVIEALPATGNLVGHHHLDANEGRDMTTSSLDHGSNEHGGAEG